MWPEQFLRGSVGDGSQEITGRHRPLEGLEAHGKDFGFQSISRPVFISAREHRDDVILFQLLPKNEKQLRCLEKKLIHCVQWVPRGFRAQFSLEPCLRRAAMLWGSLGEEGRFWVSAKDWF